MRALDLKLLRDFQRIWLQALAIAMVLACGVAILLTSWGLYRSLEETRTAYYDRNSFADVFAVVNRAPGSLLQDVQALPGVAMAEARVRADVVLDIEGKTESAIGRILSLPPDGPLLNVPILRSGRLPAVTSTTEVVLSAPFASANGLRVGDGFDANMGGQQRRLVVVGTALSPEFIYSIGPGALMPDDEGFGIIWMPQRAVEGAFDLGGAFNDLALTLAPGTEAAVVIDALDDILSRYGGLGAFERVEQESDAFLSAEIAQLRGMALVLPPIFFAISAFLVAMVLGRLIALERAEIGLLKALGYSSTEICVHYLVLAALIAGVGVAIGWLAGGWMARGLGNLYAQYFSFPFLLFGISAWVYAASALAAVAATVIGAARAALGAAMLPPAVAMQPPAPPQYRKSVVDRLMGLVRLGQPTIMILRSVTRWPLRSAMTVLGLATAVAAVASSSFMQDALDHIIDRAFFQSNRQDAVLILNAERPIEVLTDIAALPAVLQAEGTQFHPAILRNGAEKKRVAIEARLPGADLSRVADKAGRTIDVPPGGIVLSQRLVETLGVAVGDTLEVEFLTGRQETHHLPVTGSVEQNFGLGAFVDLNWINTTLRQSPRITAANVTLDDAATDALHAQIKDTPALSGVVMMTDMRRSFEDTIEESAVTMLVVYITMAVLITVGVAYNGARIMLSERARELASLRILGFTRGEVSYILIGESALLALLAQPVGWGLGMLIAWSMTESFSSDLYTIPMVIRPPTFAFASLVVLSAVLVSVLIVRRRIDRLDLVAVMKTRE